jgi:hypothetical protein
MGGIDVSVTWVLIALEERNSGKNLTSLAVAALRNIDFMPSFLDWMFTFGVESLDGRYIHASYASRWGDAGSHGRSI